MPVVQIVDCIYGDVGDCSSLSPSDCYSVALEHQCCGFCNKHKTNKPGNLKRYNYFLGDGGAVKTIK